MQTSGFLVLFFGGLPISCNMTVLKLGQFIIFLCRIHWSAEKKSPSLISTKKLGIIRACQEGMSNSWGRSNARYFVPVSQVVNFE